MKKILLLVFLLSQNNLLSQELGNPINVSPYKHPTPIPNLHILLAGIILIAFGKRRGINDK